MDNQLKTKREGQRKMPLKILKNKWKLLLLGSIVLTAAMGYLGGYVSADYLIGKLSIKAMIISFLSIWAALIAEDKIDLLKSR